MMEYEKTHPWISFTLNLGVDYEPLWYHLGKACSKIKHLAWSAMDPQVHKELNQIYLVKGVRATTAIEGNTLSEKEVADILEKKLTLPPSKQYQEQEITNVVAACNKIVEDTCGEHVATLTPDYIAELNRMLLEGLSVEEGVEPGKVRQYSVIVGKYRGAPAQECAVLLEKLCQWLQSEQFTSAPPDMKHAMAIIQAIVAHIYLAWIHPFGDGNGRTARLVEVFLLLKAGVPVPAAHLLSNFYNETRSRYYVELDKLSTLVNGRYPSLASFLSYAVEGLADGLDNQIEIVTNHHLKIIWEHHVYMTFGAEKTEIHKRQRELLLSFDGKPRKITSFDDISPNVYHTFYRRKTFRTLTRDLKELCRRELLELTPEGYKPRTDILFKMMPTRADAV